VVTAPRVATLDGNKATNHPVRRSRSYSVTVGGIANDGDLQDVGVQLNYAPVNSDNMITLSLKPQVSSWVTAEFRRADAFIINTRRRHSTVGPDGKRSCWGGLISR